MRSPSVKIWLSIDIWGALKVLLTINLLRWTFSPIPSTPLILSGCLFTVVRLSARCSMILNTSIVICIVISWHPVIFSRCVLMVVLAALFLRRALLVRSLLSPVWLRLLMILVLLILMMLLGVEVRYVVFNIRLWLQRWLPWLLSTFVLNFGLVVRVAANIWSWLRRAVVLVLLIYDWLFLLSQLVFFHQVFDGNSLWVFGHLVCSASSNYAHAAAKTTEGTAYHDGKS